ncbi:MAG: TIM barrel protein [Terriglobia bacterium]
MKNQITVSLDSRRDFLKKTSGKLAAAMVAAGGLGSGTARAGQSGQAQEIREIKASTPGLKIGVFDAAFHDLSIDQLIEMIKEFKLQAVEIGSGNDPGNAHCDLDGLLADDSKRRAYMEQFEKSGIMVSAFSCHGNPVHPDADKAKREGAVYRKSIDLAAKTGVGRVVCFSGCPGDGTGKHPNWVTTLETGEFVNILKWQWNEVLIPYWKDLNEYARQRSVKVALEMDGGYSVFNVATLLKLRQAAGENIGANLDLSGLFQLGVDPVAVVKKLGEEGCLYHMHGKDILLDAQNVAVNGLVDLTPYADIEHRSWSYADIGYGHDLVVWKAIVEQLKAVGYEHVISIEHESPFTSSRVGVAKSAEALDQILLNRAQIL